MPVSRRVGPQCRAFKRHACKHHYTKGGNIGGRAGERAFGTGGGYGDNWQDHDNLKVDRSIWAYDIPQILNIASTYYLPFGTGKPFLNRKGLLNGVLGGWRLTGNFNTQNGLPLGISGPCDNLQIEEADDVCRVNVVGNPRFSGSRSKAQRIADWINPAAFEPVFGSDQSFWANYNSADPRAWLFSKSGALLPNFRGPGFWNLDASLGKEFHFTEQRYFEFRWDVFNAPNHQNLGLPNTGFCLPPLPDGTVDLVHQAGCQFGRITNVQTDPRAMEFALKFFW